MITCMMGSGGDEDEEDGDDEEVFDTRELETEVEDKRDAR